MFVNLNCSNTLRKFSNIGALKIEEKYTNFCNLFPIETVLKHLPILELPCGTSLFSWSAALQYLIPLDPEHEIYVNKWLEWDATQLQVKQTTLRISMAIFHFLFSFRVNFIFCSFFQSFVVSHIIFSYLIRHFSKNEFVLAKALQRLCFHEKSLKNTWSMECIINSWIYISKSLHSSRMEAPECWILRINLEYGRCCRS